MEAPKYSVPQQVAAFAFSANSAANLSFASLADMQEYVTKISNVNLADSVIQGLIGSDWTPVWGPIVWINPSQHGTKLIADNTMSCYYSLSQNLFVIAVAGTNPTSMFDWEKEDFSIATMVKWSTVSPGSGSDSGYISTGSYTGITNLLNMVSQAAQGNTLLNALQNYIQSKGIKNSTIAIGGHSLGGALAPCLGLYMFDNLDKLGLSGQNIGVYAYAGPTPGGSAFAKYYDSKINGTTFTYSSQYNTIDAIPMGSVLADLATIPGIYGNNIPFKDSPVNTFAGIVTTGLQVASLAGKMSSGGGPYTQVSTNRTSFTAPFNSDVYTNCSSVIAEIIKATYLFGVSETYLSELANVVNFMYQVAVQHGPSYCGGTITLPMPDAQPWVSKPVTGYLGIDDFTTEYQLNLKNYPPQNATFDSGIARTIQKLTGIDLTNSELFKNLQDMKSKSQQELLEQ